MRRFGEWGNLWRSYNPPNIGVYMVLWAIIMQGNLVTDSAPMMPALRYTGYAFSLHGVAAFPTRRCCSPYTEGLTSLHGADVVPARGRRSSPTKVFTSPNEWFDFPQRSKRSCRTSWALRCCLSYEIHLIPHLRYLPDISSLNFVGTHPLPP